MPLAPPAPHKYWLIIDHVFSWSPTGKVVCVTTDIPCHLYMHFHPLGPGRHLRMILRRGVVTFKDPHYGFEEYQVIFQQQAGDTLKHTFLIEPWLGEPFLWYRFTGNIGGVKSPSVSPWWWQNDHRLQYQQIFLEEWSPCVSEPPEMALIFAEPWTYLAPPPPVWGHIFTEPWTS